MKSLVLTLLLFTSPAALAETRADSQAKTAAEDRSAGPLTEIFAQLHKQYCTPFAKDVKKHGDCLEFERGWEEHDGKGSDECMQKWEGDPNGRDLDCAEAVVKNNTAARHARFKLCGGLESYFKDKKAFQTCFEKRTKK